MHGCAAAAIHGGQQYGSTSFIVEYSKTVEAVCSICNYVSEQLGQLCPR